MDTIELHPDFSDFLRLLHAHRVEYLLVGGYAVGYYGYPRATGDMDIWIRLDRQNATKTAQALAEFGMPAQECTADLFMETDKVIRMGVPPVRIEVITGASGVDFDSCYKRRKETDINGIPVNIISLEDLKTNKKASGRHQDLDDIEHLP